jgi:hypothetical protein
MSVRKQPPAGFENGNNQYLVNTLTEMSNMLMYSKPAGGFNVISRQTLINEKQPQIPQISQIFILRKL